jgi:class IV lanthipeptide synthase
MQDCRVDKDYVLLFRRIDEDGAMFGPFWCHGAAGIGRFLLHASQLDLAPEANDFSVRAAVTVARGARWAGPTQCHGLSGNIEFLLDMAQATHDHRFLLEAGSLARLLEVFAVNRDGMLFWQSELPTIVTPDYLVGYAGVAVCLLRLSEPETMPHQLSRPGFRRQPFHPERNQHN